MFRGCFEKNKNNFVIQIKVHTSTINIYLSFDISALNRANARYIVLLVPPTINLANKIQWKLVAKCISNQNTIIRMVLQSRIRLEPIFEMIKPLHIKLSIDPI